VRPVANDLAGPLDETVEQPPLQTHCIRPLQDVWKRMRLDRHYYLPKLAHDAEHVVVAGQLKLAAGRDSRSTYFEVDRPRDNHHLDGWYRDESTEDAAAVARSRQRYLPLTPLFFLDPALRRFL
jgi:hypothetical protein